MLSNLPWLKSLISLILHKDLSDCMQSKTKLNSFYLCVCSVASDCGPMGCSPPGSSVHGIIQTRILQWVAIAFSKCPSLQVENHPEEKQDVLKMKGRHHGSWQTFSFCSHQSGFMEATLQTFHCELCPAETDALAEVWHDFTLLLRLWRGLFFLGHNLCFAATKTQFTQSSPKPYLLDFIWKDLHESIHVKSIHLNFFFWF